jgi:hypothetical protein
MDKTLNDIFVSLIDLVGIRRAASEIKKLVELL